MICFVFDNARAVIKAEELLKNNGYTCSVIPAPSEISSSCGMMLSVEDRLQDGAVVILNEKNIKFNIYER